MWPKTKQCNNSVRSTHFIVTDNVCNWVWQRQGNESQCETLLWCLNIVQFSPHFPFSFFIRSFISCSLHLLLDQLSNCWLCDAKFVKCTTEHERISRNQKQKSANETKWNFSNKLTIAANIHSQTHTHTHLAHAHTNFWIETLAQMAFSFHHCLWHGHDTVAFIFASFRSW